MSNYIDIVKICKEFKEFELEATTKKGTIKKS